MKHLNRESKTPEGTTRIREYERRLKNAQIALRVSPITIISSNDLPACINQMGTSQSLECGRKIRASIWTCQDCILYVFATCDKSTVIENASYVRCIRRCHANSEVFSQRNWTRRTRFKGSPNCKRWYRNWTGPQDRPLYGTERYEIIKQWRATKSRVRLSTTSEQLWRILPRRPHQIARFRRRDTNRTCKLRTKCAILKGKPQWVRTCGFRSGHGTAQHTFPLRHVPIAFSGHEKILISCTINASIAHCMLWKNLWWYVKWQKLRANPGWLSIRKSSTCSEMCSSPYTIQDNDVIVKLDSDITFDFGKTHPDTAPIWGFFGGILITGSQLWSTWMVIRWKCQNRTKTRNDFLIDHTRRNSVSNEQGRRLHYPATSSFRHNNQEWHARPELSLRHTSNGNEHVLIEDLNIDDFEISAISLSGCNDVCIRRCKIGGQSLRPRLRTPLCCVLCCCPWTERKSTRTWVTTFAKNLLKKKQSLWVRWIV